MPGKYLRNEIFNIFYIKIYYKAPLKQYFIKKNNVTFQSE